MKQTKSIKTLFCAGAQASLIALASNRLLNISLIVLLLILVSYIAPRYKRKKLVRVLLIILLILIVLAYLVLIIYQFFMVSADTQVFPLC